MTLTELGSDLDYDCVSDGQPAVETADGAPPVGAPPISVLGKAHLLLAAFTEESSCMGLTELSRRSGVPKATVHRLICELVELGYLTRNATEYQLGWRFFELGQLVPGPAHLSSVARPVLVDLRSALRAIAVHVTIPQGGETVYLERLAGRREIGPISVMGERAPSLLTASGRLFLAHDARRVPLLAGYEGSVLQRAFRATRSPDLHELHRYLDTVRERRWADEREECVQGMKTFAVPVLDGDRVVAGISASVPLDRRHEQEIVHALWAAASDVTRALGRRLVRPAESTL